MNLRPDRSIPAVKPRPKKKLMTFETALRHLRRGKNIRRVAWHPESRIFKLDRGIYLKPPQKFGEHQERPGIGVLYGSRPEFWKPYPGDFLATDWEIAR